MTYVVLAGDTLARIAERCGTSVAAILEENPHIEDPRLIFPGEEIRLPAGAAIPQGMRRDDASAGFAATYVVRSGDSMGALAAHFGVGLADLVAANPHIPDPDLIRPGNVLNVPEAGGEGAPITVTPPAAHDLPTWLAMAKREMDTGVDEVVGSAHNPRIVEYHQTTTLRATDDETPWCSSFVNWCIQQSGISGTRSAAARSWLGWGSRLDRPRRGAITVFSRESVSPTAGHVGFYWSLMGDRVLVLGGNQGDQVSIKGYPRRDLLGYRWPD